MSIVDYIEDLPDVKQYKATFCITMKVSGENEADAIQEAWTKFEEHVLDITSTDINWTESFSIQIEELKN